MQSTYFFFFLQIRLLLLVSYQDKEGGPGRTAFVLRRRPLSEHTVSSFLFFLFRYFIFFLKRGEAIQHRGPGIHSLDRIEVESIYPIAFKPSGRLL